MGQQLIGRPVSQRSSFGTLNTSSKSTSPDLSQYLGFTTPMQQQPAATSQLVNAGQFTQNPISSLGFRGYGGMPRGFGGLPGRQMQS